MDLQLALLVAGTLVIALVIAVSLVDRARRPRPRRVEPEAEAAGVLRMRVPRAAVQPITLTLDINPAPAAAAEHRSLKSDAAVEPMEPSKLDAITEELEVLADVAQVPLN
ncbi:MAG: hypothetical protein AAB294_05995, partial [Pseudomonadota bacterium]